MKITEMIVTPVAFRDPPLRNSTGVHQPWALRVIVQLRTDDGYEGAGETHGARPIIDGLNAVKSRILGQDPFQIEQLRRLVPNPRVFSPIETACLDIIGKVVGRPVCDVIGGRVRDEVEFAAYLFFKFEGDDEYGEVLTPEAFLEEAKLFHRRHGFRVHKIKGGVLPPEQELETVRLLREHFGDSHGIRIDPNAIWTVETSIWFAKASQEYRLEYLEDPTWGREAMAEVQKHVEVPLSTNMCVTAFHHISDAVHKGSIKVLLADHHVWGGVTACKQLGKVCEAAGWGMSQHSNSHLGISLMAMTHMAAATPQLTYASDTHYIWTPEDVIKGDMIPIVDGKVRIPDRPGLGVEIDPDKLAKLHENYIKHGYDRRDDVAEMRKYIPDWEPKRPRW